MTFKIISINVPAGNDPPVIRNYASMYTMFPLRLAWAETPADVVCKHYFAKVMEKFSPLRLAWAAYFGMNTIIVASIILPNHGSKSCHSGLPGQHVLHE